jgi:hypothetical protein
MSSDNYLLVRRAGTRWAVSGESASAQDHEPGDPIDDALWRVDATAPIDAAHLRWFDDRDSAVAHAHDQYAEYGVQIIDDDCADDTYLARLRAVATAVLDGDESAWDPDMWTNDRANNTIALSAGELTVTVTAATMDDARRYATWLRLLAPERIATLGG